MLAPFPVDVVKAVMNEVSSAAALSSLPAHWALIRKWPARTCLMCVSFSAPPPPKRAPTTALSMRSKSMTSELEELGKSASCRFFCAATAAFSLTAPFHVPSFPILWWISRQWTKVSSRCSYFVPDCFLPACSGWMKLLLLRLFDLDLWTEWVPFTLFLVLCCRHACRTLHCWENAWTFMWKHLFAPIVVCSAQKIPAVHVHSMVLLLARPWVKKRTVHPS